MPPNINLNQNPYWDDYSWLKNYYQVLFKPGVSVQTRELNALQSMIQAQIEAFGDNIFANSAIVSGCNFQFLNPYPYIQLNDLDVFNNAVNPATFVGYNVENETTGLQAQILNYANGYQATPPNLKTLYIKYLNTGSSGANLTTFSVGDVLTIYNPVFNPIELINISGGGTGFSNSNLLVVVPAIICTLNSGSLPTVGSYLNNGNGIANVQVVSVNTYTQGVANQYVIGISPLTTFLSNAQCNSQFWSFNVSDTLTNPSNTNSLTVNQVVGSGAYGNIVTSSVGTIINVPLTSTGVGYLFNPFITVQSPNNVAGYTTLNLQPQNFLTQVIVAAGANTIGNGYAFGVTQGVIFQQGMFVDVLPQTIIVSPFSSTPSNTAVGLTTTSQIINYQIDSSLVDNANGQLNYQAPGADRLQLIPLLQVVNTTNVSTNTNFLTLVQWDDGVPYLQNQQTIYNIIGSEMAQRTEDADGDFVIDPFVVTTQNPLDTNNSAQYFGVVVDPGTAYINGYKVQTMGNFNLDDQAGINTSIVNNHVISLNYGNYFICNNVAGTFPFNVAANVSLYDTARQYYSNSTNMTLNPAGNKIGTALVRSLVLDQMNPGPGASEYDLYVFYVTMNAGSSVANVKSISYSNGTANVGIADIVLQSLNTSNTNIASTQDTNINQLVFWSGVNSLKNANNASYIYRTVNTALTISNGSSGSANLVINAPSGQTFPYGAGSLSLNQMQDFYVVPTSGDMVETNAISGTVSIGSASNTVTGSSTSFNSNLHVGDWIYLTANSTGGHVLVQISTITNAISLTVSANPGFTNASGTLYRVYPQYVPIPFGAPSGQPGASLTANVNVSQNQAILTFPRAFQFSGTTTATAAFNIQLSNATQQTKTANRNVYVELCTSNNAGGQAGPWCLGVPDVFRLRAVYIGNSSVTNTGTNYISSFIVKANQSPNYVDLGYLYQIPGTTVPLTANSYMLVCFDYFTTSGVGFYDTVSYLQTAVANTIFTQDSLPLANLTTFCNSLEVPIVYYPGIIDADLLNSFDFRPYVSNTVAATTNSAAAPLNPPATVAFGTSEKMFPVPDSNFTATLEQWLPRIDSVYVDQNGNFTIGTGSAAANISLCVPSIQPTGTMKIVDMVIPQYPTIPNFAGSNIQQILATQMGGPSRVQGQTIYNLSANSSLPFNQPAVYTMADIGSIDRQVQQLQQIITTSQLEANAASLSIPSSIDPSTGRTIYGIFTDNFSTSDFSATTDSEYQALNQGGIITPEMMQWDQTLFSTGGIIPFVQVEILSQDVATVQPSTISGNTNPNPTPILDPIAGPPVCAINLANTVAYTLLYRNSQDFPATTTIDSVQLQLASQATVFESVNDISVPLAEYITKNQYNPYAFNFGTTITGQFAGVSNPGAYVNQIISTLQNLPNISGYTYNASNQTLTVNYQDAADASAVGYNITGIPQSVATLFGQALTGQITWAQFMASLNVSGNAPGGGAFAETMYNPPVSFYFYNFASPVKYRIWQGITLIASTDPADAVISATNLTAQDISLLTGSATNYWFSGQGANPGVYLKNFQTQSGGYVTYAGKMVFNYDPTLGSGFSIRAIPQTPGANWRYVMAYPVDGGAAGCVTPPVNQININASLTPVFSTYSAQAWCGNGLSGSGQVSILTGYTATWNNPTITPTTVIAPIGGGTFGSPLGLATS